MSITSAKSGATGISLALDNNYMEPIASVLVSASSVGLIEFLDIPQTYKHLQIRSNVRSSTANANFTFQLNGDNGTNYSNHNLYGTGSAVASGSGTSETAGYCGWIAQTGTTANAFGGGILDILDYTNTNKNKTTRSLCGSDLNGSGLIIMNSACWMSTAPVTSVTLKVSLGSGGFAQYSRISLYGIKG